MGTTAGGLTYPEPTDPVADGAAAIRALAEDLDAAGTYTPALVNLTLGNGTVTGRWWANGRLLMAEAVVTWGSSTTSTQPVFVGLPTGLVPAAPAVQSAVGVWTAVDVSASAVRAGHLVRSGGNAACRFQDGTSIGGAVPWTWATGDQLIAEFAYPLSTVAALLAELRENATVVTP